MSVTRMLHVFRLKGDIFVNVMRDMLEMEEIVCLVCHVSIVKYSA